MRTSTPTRLLATIAAATTLLLAGCEKENTVNNTPIAARVTSNIAAQGSANDALQSPTAGSSTNSSTNSSTISSTRAAGTAWTSGDLIGIYATSSPSGATTYTNVKYTASSDGTFTPVNAAGEDNNIYFQDKADVTFTAYYPHAGTNGTLPGTDGTLARTLTAADQTEASLPGIDYLHAAPVTASAALPEVKFTFHHCMSRILLSFTEGDDMTFSDQLTYTLSGIRLQGTFNTLDGTAAIDPAAATGSLEDIPVNTTSTQASSSYLILWPQQADAATLTVTVDNTPYTAQIAFPALPGSTSGEKGLAPGYSYQYNVKVNKTRLTISPATISDWTQGTSQDVGAWN